MSSSRVVAWSRWLVVVSHTTCAHMADEGRNERVWLVVCECHSPRHRATDLTPVITAVWDDPQDICSTFSCSSPFTSTGLYLEQVRDTQTANRSTANEFANPSIRTHTHTHTAHNQLPNNARTYEAHTHPLARCANVKQHTYMVFNGLPSPRRPLSPQPHMYTSPRIVTHPVWELSLIHI